MTIICPVTLFIITAYFRQVVSIGTFYYADKQCWTARWNVLLGWFLTSLHPPMGFCLGWGSAELQWACLLQHASPLSCGDQPEAATPFHCMLSRDIMPQTCTALRKPRTNTSVFPLFRSSFPSRLLLLSQIHSLSLCSSIGGPALLNCCCFQDLEWGAWCGLSRRCGYIWLFIEKSSGTHPHCYLGDAAWRVSGSHIVLTRTWYCLGCIRAFLYCLSISPCAALYLLTSFACQTPRSVSQKVCVCLCSTSLGVLWGGTWARCRHLGENSPWWCWWH